MNPFQFQATGIGSLGYTHSQQAASFVLNLFKEIPFWVQLPQRSFKENMYVQFSEGIPGIVIKEEERKIYVDTRKINAEELVDIYESYLNRDTDGFAVSEEYAEGLYEFLRQINPENPSYIYLKGQITGPVSFLLTVTDENKRPLLYNEEIADVILKILTLKAVWQVKKIKEIFEKVIIFIDEPYLVSIGSGFVNLDPQKIVNNLNEMMEVIKPEKAVVGIHCCGNTDWGLLTQTKTELISFDAYNFSESLLLYPEAINKFIKRGGVISWGIVPTDLDTGKVNAEAIFERLQRMIKLLIQRGIERDLIIQQSLVTPSCGLGSYSPQKGEIVLRITQEVSERIRNEFR
ncbi:MAG: hypothetical protein NC834_03500 [Candidatus Omnitrophica bacterium]|nr:hypothetical protein [Candidatus Omnitrophota bacterium]